MSIVLAIVNFKGGVGKSTIANLLDLENSVIINLDVSQNAEKHNIQNKETINFYEMQEENDISLTELIQIAQEEGKNVILDTPGEINEEYLEVLPIIDHYIVPFMPAPRSTETTIDTISTIIGYKKIKEIDKEQDWCLILNNYDDEELAMIEIDTIKKSVNEILEKDNLVCITKLKHSKVVSTVEKVKKNIDELILKNKVAYRVFAKRLLEMNNDIKYKFLKMEQ